MSFVPEKNETIFYPVNNPNITGLPYQYLPQIRNLSNEIPLENAWHKEGCDKNTSILDRYNIYSNQEYRKYMIKNGKDIITLNQKEYKKQSIR
jgi:hypothetical protein